MKFLLQYDFSPLIKSYCPKFTFAFYNLASSGHECIYTLTDFGNSKKYSIMLLSHYLKL